MSTQILDETQSDLSPAPTTPPTADEQKDTPIDSEGGGGIDEGHERGIGAKYGDSNPSEPGEDEDEDSSSEDEDSDDLERGYRPKGPPKTPSALGHHRWVIIVGSSSLGHHQPKKIAGPYLGRQNNTSNASGGLTRHADHEHEWDEDGTTYRSVASPRRYEVRCPTLGDKKEGLKKLGRFLREAGGKDLSHLPNPHQGFAVTMTSAQREVFSAKCPKSFPVSISEQSA